MRDYRTEEHVRIDQDYVTAFTQGSYSGVAIAAKFLIR
jgi:hypothetical protein